MASLGTLLVNAKIGDAIIATTQHAPFHGAHHDGVNRTPRQTGKFTYPFCGGADLQQLDHEAFHQQGDPAVSLSPRHAQLFDCAVAVLELGYACFNKCLKLASVQMPPLALTPTVDVGSLGGVRGVNP